MTTQDNTSSNKMIRTTTGIRDKYFVKITETQERVLPLSVATAETAILGTMSVV